MKNHVEDEKLMYFKKSRKAVTKGEYQSIFRSNLKFVMTYQS